MKKKTVSGSKDDRVSPRTRKGSGASKTRKTTAGAKGKPARAEPPPAKKTRPSERKAKSVKHDSESGIRTLTGKSAATTPPPTVIAPVATRKPTVSPSGPVKPLTPRTAPPDPLNELEIPGILLEGDEPSQFVIPPVRGTSQSGPWPTPVLIPSGVSRDLPEPYGTGELSLSARDPHWLYAHWDLPREAQRRFNSLSSDGLLVLRTCLESSPEEPVSELRVHPESQHWFVHVHGAGKKYVSVLGYYGEKREWVAITASAAVSTPPDAPSSDVSVSFAPLGFGGGRQSIPSEMHGDRGLAAAPQPHSVQDGKDEWLPVAPRIRVEPAEPSAAQGSESSTNTPDVSSSGGLIAPGVQKSDAQTTAIPLEAESAMASRVFVSAMADVPPHGLKGATPGAAPISEEPSVKPATGTSMRAGMRIPEENWTLMHERTLLELIYGLQPTTAHEPKPELRLPTPSPVSSAAYAPHQPAALDLPQPGFPERLAGGISSPGAPAITAGARPFGRAGDFWMNVNAELVIYGATEPTAAVSLGGRRIRLRPDGTFSYRFSLPDGSYELEVKAISSGGDTRSAQLGFSRSTQKAGEIAAHPQEPGLRPPVPESI